jgi:hypothetical protein
MLSVITENQINQYQTRTCSGYNSSVMPKAPNLGGFFIGGKMRECKIEGCHEKHHGLGFCHRHYQKFKMYGTPFIEDRKRKNGDGCVREGGYLLITKNGKSEKKHRIIIKKILGHEINKRHPVHHFDGNGGNNENHNLVLCESQFYHGLLHKRAKALKECGHADWLMCRYCKEYDSPNNLYTEPRPGKHSLHRSCGSQYKRDLLKRKKLDKADCPHFSEPV